MPLYKRIDINDFTRLIIWKIEENLNNLSQDIILEESRQKRVDSMNSEIHQKGFYSVRHLLKELGYTDLDLTYDEFGKPHLKDGNFISITHSFHFSAIIISEKTPVGIDIEKQRDKIVRIARKFTPIQEYKTIANHDALVSKLTIVWGAKESLYKIYGKKKLLFLKHIYIEDFKFADGKTVGTVRYEDHKSDYEVFFLEFEGFTCVYAF